MAIKVMVWGGAADQAHRLTCDYKNMKCFMWPFKLRNSLYLTQKLGNINMEWLEVEEEQKEEEEQEGPLASAFLARVLVPSGGRAGDPNGREINHGSPHYLDKRPPSPPPVLILILSMLPFQQLSSFSPSSLFHLPIMVHPHHLSPSPTPLLPLTTLPQQLPSAP